MDCPRQMVIQAVLSNQNELITLSRNICFHLELSFRERYAAVQITKPLEYEGFVVPRQADDLKTTLLAGTLTVIATRVSCFLPKRTASPAAGQSPRHNLSPAARRTAGLLHAIQRVRTARFRCLPVWRAPSRAAERRTSRRNCFRPARCCRIEDNAAPPGAPFRRRGRTRPTHPAPRRSRDISRTRRMPVAAP